MWLKRESESEREREGRWRQQQKIVKWVSVAGERERERERIEIEIEKEKEREREVGSHHKRVRDARKTERLRPKQKTVKWVRVAGESERVIDRKRRG